jgi:hypothetical protein
MSRVFSSASSQYLSRNAAIASIPCTFSAWYRPTTTVDGHVLAICSTAQSTTNYLALQPWSDGYVYATQRYADSSATAKSGVTLSNGVWYHLAGVFTSTTSRTVFVDGSGVTNTTSKTDPSSVLSVTLIGSVYWDSTNDYRYFANGQIAEVAVWSVALAASEIAALAKAHSPLKIRPASLVAYYPLGGFFGASDADRWKSRRDLSPQASPSWATHPRVIQYGAAI